MPFDQSHSHDFSGGGGPSREEMFQTMVYGMFNVIKVATFMMSVDMQKTIVVYIKSIAEVFFKEMVKLDLIPADTDYTVDIGFHGNRVRIRFPELSEWAVRQGFKPIIDTL